MMIVLHLIITVNNCHKLDLFQLGSYSVHFNRFATAMPLYVKARH